MHKRLDTPVVLFTFKRKLGALAVLDRIAEARPRRLYLISDGARDSAEWKLVEDCRRSVRELVDWDCEVIEHYASANMGVHERIGLGAKWVFEREEQAIFLEDDNLPEPSFFDYCVELLDRYADDMRVVWICGTNYFTKMDMPETASYTFTKHLLPCGWASWANKFGKFYDANLDLYTEELVARVEGEYLDRRLFLQDMAHIRAEIARRDEGERYWSWDYHMAYSIRVHGLLGIAPARNQIRNIGADQFSAHGGSSLNDVMTRRFCEVPTSPLDFPLRHPKVVLRDRRFDRLVNRVVLYPLSKRVKKGLGSTVKRLLFLPESTSLTSWARRTAKEHHVG